MMFIGSKMYTCNELLVRGRYVLSTVTSQSEFQQLSTQDNDVPLSTRILLAPSYQSPWER